MASCCTGVTECDQVITIGFLNSFIGSDVQDSNGAAQTAAGDSDYCPTYSELTGGSLIQNWEQGTTPNGDKDGIIIGGSYASDECVRRSDLSMKFTRFKEFSISAASTTLSACSASTTISYTHKYDRCERKIDSTCESAKADSCTTVKDTTNSEVTLTSSNNVFSLSNFNKVSVPKNDPNGTGRSNSRQTTITGTITFRGTNHTDTVTIVQNGLDGEYVNYDTGYTKYYSYDRVTISPWDFGCSGGAWVATGYYTSHRWKILCWKDDCGDLHTNDTITDYDEYPTGSVTVSSGTFSVIDCSKLTKDYDSGHITVSWHGKSDWMQQKCKKCECEDHEVAGDYTPVSYTMPCTGGSIRVNYNITAYTCSVNESGECECSSSVTSDYTYVTAGCNTSSSPISLGYGITQTAGPCCTPSTSYSYATVTLSCNAHENENVRAKYTATTRDSCCNYTYPTGYTSYYKVNVGCNSGSTRTLSASEKGNAPFTVKQEGNSACCVTCKCENVNLNAQVTTAGSSIPASGYSSSTIIGTYDNTTCLSSITATSSQNWATVSVSNGNVNATVQANTSLTNDRNSTITVQGIDALGSTCSDTFNIKQVMSAITCVCSDLTINKTSETWDYNVTTSKDITITSASCISNIATGGTLTHFTATISSGKVTVQPNGNNTTYSAYTETFNITYKASGNDCSSAITLTQNPNQCVCTNLTVSPTSLSWSANSTSSKDITVTSASCITNISLSSPTHFNASLSNNKISVSPKGNNSSCSAYSDTLVVSYKAGNNTCSSSVTLTQNATACTCTNLTVSPTSLTWEFNNTTSKNVTVTSASCITNISLNAPSHFNASLNNGSIIITPKSQNTGNVDYVDTLIVSYSGCSTPCSSSITLTQKVSECLCENVNLNVSATAAGVSIPSIGYSAPTVIGTYNNSTCLTSITATSNQNWVTNINVSNGNVSAKVSENTNIGENRNATINVFGFDGVGVACMGTFNVSQTTCTPGVTWEIDPVKITCDAVNVGSVLCDTNLIKAEVYIEDGICKTRTTTYNTVHIWNDAPASVIPANDTNNDKTLYINVYTDGTNFFTTSDAAGGGPSIGTCVVTQLKCIESCIPGTDNAYDESTGAREPVHLECSIDAITTDHYLGNWTKDQHVYGRNQESGEQQNVSSFTVNEGSTVGWHNYLEFLNANDVVQEYPDITNSYGAKSLQANDLGEDIWLKVKHVIINKNIQPPLSNTCDEWYSFIQFRPCDPYTYNVYSNVEGARVDFYSNTSSNHHYGYGFINNGICYKEIKYNSVKVVISKDGCTFSPNEVVMSNGGSVTLNGNCSAPPQTQYTYTVYGDSNSNGATVIFYYGGTAIDSGSIANGSYTFVTTTNYGRIDVFISKSDCIITPSSTTLDADSSVSVTASCSGPQPTYYTYTVNGNSDANGATVILSYNLSPVADGVITNGYYTFTTTTYYDSLDAYISKNGCTITPDSTSILVNNSVTVTADCSGPQPSYYTYTVNDSNGNAEGAEIAWWYNGTQFNTTTIVNGVSQITRQDGVTVDVVVVKDGCTASYSPGNSISANGSITVTMNCGSPGTCTWCGDINLSLSTTYNPPSYASGVGEPIAMFDATPVCEGNFIATYYRGDEYLYDMTVSNIGGDSYMVYASWPENQGAERAESIAITFVTSEGNYISCEYPEITQPAGPCATATTLVLSSTSLFTPSSDGGNADIILDGDVNCYSLTYSYASVPQIHLGEASIMGGRIVIPVQFEANDSGDTGKITLKFGNIDAGDEKTFEIDVEWQW